MILKFIFDRVVALKGLLFLWPVLLIVAILIKIKKPVGPAFFVQKHVWQDWGSMIRPCFTINRRKERRNISRLFGDFKIMN